MVRRLGNLNPWLASENLREREREMEAKKSIGNYFLIICIIRRVIHVQLFFAQLPHNFHTIQIYWMELMHVGPT
jgi:hypothetical protein